MKNKNLISTINRSCNYHNPQLAKLSKYGISGASQCLLITFYCGIDGHRPVNYIIPPKTDGWELASFLTELQTPVDIDWCTLYDGPPYKGTYVNQTAYVMYIQGREKSGGSWHAIPMFSDTALSFNKLKLQRDILMHSAQASLKHNKSFQLSEDDLDIIDGLDIIDDTFASLLDWKAPRRPMMRTIMTGPEIQLKKFSQKVISILQVTEDGTYPLAYLPSSFKDKLPPEGQKDILTDVEVHDRILRYMKFPY